MTATNPTFDDRNMSLEKIAAVDVNQSLILHREIAVAAINDPILYIPGAQPSADEQFHKSGCYKIEMSLWAEHSASGVTARVVAGAFPVKGALINPSSQSSYARNECRGMELLDAVYTFSGREFDAIHPITGQAAAGRKWFEASGCAPTYVKHADLVQFAPELSSTYFPATGREISTYLDNFGCNGLYVSTISLSAGKAVLIAFRRVS